MRCTSGVRVICQFLTRFVVCTTFLTRVECAFKLRFTTASGGVVAPEPEATLARLGRRDFSLPEKMHLALSAVQPWQLPLGLVGIRRHSRPLSQHRSQILKIDQHCEFGKMSIYLPGTPTISSSRCIFGTLLFSVFGSTRAFVTVATGNDDLSSVSN